MKKIEEEYFDKILSVLSIDEKDSLKRPIKTLYDLIDILLQRIDPKVLAKKTADISRLISLMNRYLSDAIDRNKTGSKNVSLIKDELESIKVDNLTSEDLNKIQSKLVTVTHKIASEMDDINNSFRGEQQKIIQLENKVKELEEKLQKTKDENKFDFLTGTLTRRVYEKELEKFEDRFVRLHQNYAIVFFDLDHFKQINDLYGHDSGDIVLKTFGTLLLKLTRETDIVGRYGGEEFIAAVLYLKKEELEGYVSRIKEIVTKYKFKLKKFNINITFSAGVELRSNSSSLEEMIKNADILLYRAKETGRNKIIFWDGTVL